MNVSADGATTLIMDRAQRVPTTTRYLYLCCSVYDDWMAQLYDRDIRSLSTFTTCLWEVVAWLELSRQPGTTIHFLSEINSCNSHNAARLIDYCVDSEWCNIHMNMKVYGYTQGIEDAILRAPSITFTIHQYDDGTVNIKLRKGGFCQTISSDTHFISINDYGSAYMAFTGPDSQVISVFTDLVTERSIVERLPPGPRIRCILETETEYMFNVSSTVSKDAFGLYRHFPMGGVVFGPLFAPTRNQIQCILALCGPVKSPHPSVFSKLKKKAFMRDLLSQVFFFLASPA